MKYKVTNVTEASFVSMSGLLRSGEAVNLSPSESVVLHANEMAEDATRVLDAFAESIQVTEEADESAGDQEESNKGADVTDAEKQAEELANSTSKEALIKAATEANVDASGNKLQIAARLIEAGVTTITG